MKFIELTLKGTENKILVNINLITNVWVNHKGATTVCFDDGNVTLVNESYEQVRDTILTIYP